MELYIQEYQKWINSDKLSLDEKNELLAIKNNEELRAAALDIAPDGGLLVRYESGITEKLTAGEISIAVG